MYIIMPKFEFQILKWYPIENKILCSVIGSTRNTWLCISGSTKLLSAPF